MMSSFKSPGVVAEGAPLYRDFGRLLYWAGGFRLPVRQSRLANLKHFVNAFGSRYNASRADKSARYKLLKSTNLIGSIQGKVQFKSSHYIILESSGVGYKVFVTPTLLAQLKLGQELSLVIHTYVREDQITLYGFVSLDELEFFELLLTVSGVGPKSALGIMSLASLEMIKSAIISEDPLVFTKVSGIGRKIAERVIVELKSKLKNETGNVVAKDHSDAVDALLALGYSIAEARDALKKVPKETTNLSEKVRFALKNLGR